MPGYYAGAPLEASFACRLTELTQGGQISVAIFGEREQGWEVSGTPDAGRMFSRVEKNDTLWVEEIEALRHRVEMADEAVSVVAPDLSVLGDVDCPGEMVILGVVEGDVRARTLVIESGAHIEGRVFAGRLVVGGSVNGPVTATDIRIESTARVIGNITHNMLTVEPGAYLEGRRPWRPRPVKG